VQIQHMINIRIFPLHASRRNRKPKHLLV